VRPDEVCFVTHHAFDCIGTKAAGLLTHLIGDRRKRRFGNGQYPPDAGVADSAELTTTLGALARA